jgi:exosortase/archaeosortase family protein
MRYRQAKESYDRFFRDQGLEGMKDIISFVVITLIIHFSWRFWEIRLSLFPVYSWLSQLMDWLAAVSQQQTVWLWNHLMAYGTVSEGKVVHFTSCYDISVGRSCSGMKQIMQFVILMIVYRGPWRKKIWFIPLGIILVHGTNVFRIFFTGVASMNKPEAMGFLHDNVLRWIFYLVICGLWLVWVKGIAPIRRNRP